MDGPEGCHVRDCAPDVHAAQRTRLLSAQRERRGRGSHILGVHCCMYVCMVIEGRSGAGVGYSCNDDVVNAHVVDCERTIAINCLQLLLVYRRRHTKDLVCPE